MVTEETNAAAEAVVAGTGSAVQPHQTAGILTKDEITEVRVEMAAVVVNGHVVKHHPRSHKDAAGGGGEGDVVVDLSSMDQWHLW